MTNTLEQILAEFSKALPEYNAGVYYEADPTKYDGTNADDLEAFIEKAYRVGRESAVQVGFLRQWLNEDRITDCSKLVTNEQLLSWLTPTNN